MPMFIKMGLKGTGFLGQQTSPSISLRKYKARRKILLGYPISKQFENIEDIKEYFSGDRIVCLLCGKTYKKLGNHLGKIHGVSCDKYRGKYGIPWGYGLLCNESSENYSKAMIKRMEEGFCPPLKIGDEQLAMTNRPKRKNPRALETSIKNLESVNTPGGKPLHPLTIAPDGTLETFTQKRERLTSKKGTKEFKEKMQNRTQCNAEAIKRLADYLRGRKQSKEHIKKRISKGLETRGFKNCQK